MTIKYINTTGVGLSVAAWLAHDDYDYNYDPMYISATTIIKPIRQIVLGRRIPKNTVQEVDVVSLLASRIGTAIHTGIENVWLSNYKTSLAALGYNKRVIDMIRINPTPEEVKQYAEAGEDILPVYMEQRLTKEIMGFTIGGKFDFCAEGTLEDFKSTKTYSYVHGTNDTKYPMQGGIYKWLAPEIVTEDFMKIQYIFTDWKAMELTRDPQNYPSAPTLEKTFKLKSVIETEKYIKDKLIMITKLEDAPQDEIPECSDEDLWRKPDTFKYYKNPENAKIKGKRSTKNFDTMLDAVKRKNDDGNVGEIVTVKGTVTACKYCDVCIICEQKDKYLADGSLTLGK